MTFLMFLWRSYILLLYYTTYIIINVKNLIKAKKNIKYNNPLKSVVVRRLTEQHLI